MFALMAHRFLLFVCAFVAIATALLGVIPTVSISTAKVSARAFSAVSVSTVPGSTVFIVSATATFVEPSSSGGICIGSLIHPVGLHPQPCVPKVSTLHFTHHRSVGISNSGNVSTTTTTEVHSITKTYTVTMTLSEIRPSITSRPNLSTATGFCFWAEQKILTPCTSMVVASSSTAAAVPAAHNPFKDAKGGFWGIIALIGFHN